MKVLITGSQWKELVIEKDGTGHPEIHYSNLYRTYQRWVNDGSIDRMLVSSIQLLAMRKLLDVSVIHGDGTTQAAKKGGDMIGYNGHKHINGCKEIVLSIVTVILLHLFCQLLAIAMNVLYLKPLTPK